MIAAAAASPDPVGLPTTGGRSGRPPGPLGGEGGHPRPRRATPRRPSRRDVGAAGRLAKLARVQLHDVGPGGGGLEERLTDGVDQDHHPVRGGHAHEPGTGVVADAGRQASGHDQRRRLRKPGGEPGFEVAPARGGDARTRLVEQRRLLVAGVDHRDGPSRRALDQDELVAEPAAGEIGGDGAGGRAADQPEDEGVVAQRMESSRDVDPLATGPLLDAPHAMAQSRGELVDPVGDVERDVGGDGEDDGARPWSSTSQASRAAPRKPPHPAGWRAAAAAAGPRRGGGPGPGGPARTAGCPTGPALRPGGSPGARRRRR